MTAGAPLVLRFSEIAEEHAPLVGAKALSLGLLRGAGLPVPDGFCLTTEAMRAFIRESEGLSARLDEIAAEATSGNLSLQESWAFLGETRKLIVGAKVPGRVRAAIRAAYERLGGPSTSLGASGGAAVAVRSSGAREDLEGASFAGQYETFLNVKGLDFLEDALRRCWASVWRNRVLQYAARKAGGRVSAADLAMCVVVQRLVRAETAGVLFTVNPLTGRDREMLVEACFGLGEALVSGKVNADRYAVDARTGKVLRCEIGEKASRVVPIEAGVQEVPIEGPERTRRTLDDAQCAALARLGGDVQAFYERPMDVEWAIERGPSGGEEARVHLLQARPITRIDFPPAFGEWTNANFKDGGVAGDVCAPFLASVYGEVFQVTMDRHWRDLRLLPEGRKVDWFLVAFAKPYWNVGEVKRCCLGIPGFVERDLDEDLGIAPTYEGKGIAVPFSPGAILRALPTVFAVRRLYRDRLAAARATVPRFLREYEEWDAVDPRALPDADFAGRYEAVLDLYRRVESEYFLMVYMVSVVKNDVKVIFEKANAATGGALSYLNFVVGLRDVAHLRPFHELWEIAREARRTGGRADLAAFVKRWQHHSTREMDMTVPRWGEDPQFLERMYEQYVAAAGEEETHETDPVRHAEGQRALYEGEREKARRLLRWRPILRLRLFRAIRRLRDYTWWREELRDCSTRAHFLVRRWTLEVGRRAAARGALERAEDVLMIEKPLAIDLARGALDAAKARDEAAWGRRYLKSFRRFRNPDELGARHEYGASAFGLRASGGEGPEAEACLRGVGGSPGRVRGRCRIVRRLEEGKRVEKGDVLVTVFTDPGWTPLLSLVAAIVTETGGLLSHAAVISREYGIPAVLAARGACERLRDGDEVIVDGAAGTVEVEVAAGGGLLSCIPRG